MLWNALTLSSNSVIGHAIVGHWPGAGKPDKGRLLCKYNNKACWHGNKTVQGGLHCAARSHNAPNCHRNKISISILCIYCIYFVHTVAYSANYAVATT